MSPLAELLANVDELARIYGTKGEGEQWGETVERIAALGKKAKEVRRAIRRTVEGV